MKLSEIQELIKFVAKAGVNEVEIEQKDFKILIKSESLARKKTKQAPEQLVVAPAAAAPAIMASAPAVLAAPAPAPLASAPAPAPSADNDGGNDANYHSVKSPMIGTFYRKPSPDKPEFVEVGDKVKAGDILCVVEAMKLFNEIESDVSGTIIKVLVDDSTPIEYDQPLFLIDPS
jgi:acetyl-CoA carboxylase biotin carboxyl carrier protein